VDVPFSQLFQLGRVLFHGPGEGAEAYAALYANF
jgi:hypothetical protein